MAHWVKCRFLSALSSVLQCRQLDYIPFKIEDLYWCIDIALLCKYWARRNFYEETGMKKAICLAVPILLLGGCETSNPLFSMQPQVYKPNGYALSVTRPGMATSTDTTRVAEQYCSQFGRKASLTKLANPFIVPLRDEFICEEKTAEP